MKDDLRKHTFIIIRKNGVYLAGRVFYSEQLRWTIYAHEAAKTRNKALAEKAAKRVGGIMLLYNDITREIRVL